MHLHDATGENDHLILGAGEIDTAAALLIAQKHNCRCVIEVKTADGLRQSVKHLKGLNNATEESHVARSLGQKSRHHLCTVFFRPFHAFFG